MENTDIKRLEEFLGISLDFSSLDELTLEQREREIEKNEATLNHMMSELRTKIQRFGNENIIQLLEEIDQCQLQDLPAVSVKINKQIEDVYNGLTQTEKESIKQLNLLQSQFNQ